MSPPAKQPQSGAVKLARGEIAGVRLSGAERSLLQFAQDTFGQHLTGILLSGLGEKSEARRWLFVITFTAEAGVTVRRRLYVEADDLRPEVETSLPRGREPLVILALVRLLMRNRRTPSARLEYDQGDVLKLLDWPDDEKSQRAVNDALCRYFYLNYRWALSRTELARRKLSHYRVQERFVSGYGFHEAEGEDGRMRRTANYVEFNDVFLKGLAGGSLFGVDWNSVRNIRRKIVS